MAGRILLIRGGAIGDFILTLPALRILRDAFPEAHIEILGYSHITEIAHGRFYADGIRNIEYAALAGFFNPKAELDPALCEYFAGFHQIISYLYDPDGFFEGNLRRCGVKNLILGEPRLHHNEHAALQLAQPLGKLGLFADEESLCARVFPTGQDVADAKEYLKHTPLPRLVIHPGSGGPQKNWPTQQWKEWIHSFTANHKAWQVLVVGGEADGETLNTLRNNSSSARVHFLENLPLPLLAAVLAQCQGFLGHDSGISHLAAASRCSCVLLFGPTDPAVWSPKGKHVNILRAHTRKMEDISLAEVTAMLDSFIIRSTS
ncbi:MAG: glycosyltransferase family 9 protein [Chthoniobacterales bacterium]